MASIICNAFHNSKGKMWLDYKWGGGCESTGISRPETQSAWGLNLGVFLTALED